MRNSKQRQGHCCLAMDDAGCSWIAMVLVHGMLRPVNERGDLCYLSNACVLSQYQGLVPWMPSQLVVKPIRQFRHKLAAEGDDRASV